MAQNGVASMVITNENTMGFFAASKTLRSFQILEIISVFLNPKSLGPLEFG